MKTVHLHSIEFGKTISETICNHLSSEKVSEPMENMLISSSVQINHHSTGGTNSGAQLARRKTYTLMLKLIQEFSGLDQALFLLITKSNRRSGVQLE